MTKKQFEFVALLINAADKGVKAEHLAVMAAAHFAKGNPRFDEDKFFDACFDRSASECHPQVDGC